MSPFIPLLQLFRGPKVVAIDIKGVRGTFLTFRGHGAEKVKNHCTRRSMLFFLLPEKGPRATK